MINLFYAATAIITGIISGVIFFAGLWFTTQKLAAAKLPAIWFLASFVTRMAVAVAGFYLAAQGRWQGILLCLAGFITARFFVTRFVKKRNPLIITEVGHAIKP